MTIVRELSSSSGCLLAIIIEDECTNVLRDHITRGSIELDQLFQKGQTHEALFWQMACCHFLLLRSKDYVLKEVSEHLDVTPIVFTVELLEDSQQSGDKVWTIYCIDL